MRVGVGGLLARHRQLGGRQAPLPIVTAPGLGAARPPGPKAPHVSAPRPPTRTRRRRWIRRARSQSNSLVRRVLIRRPRVKCRVSMSDLVPGDESKVWAPPTATLIARCGKHSDPAGRGPSSASASHRQHGLEGLHGATRSTRCTGLRDCSPMEMPSVITTAWSTVVALPATPGSSVTS